MDTGVFEENRYFDVFMEYAKAAPEDILIKITAWNRGPEEAQLDLLPTLWFRNIWSFGEKHGHPKLWRTPDFMSAAVVAAEESRYGKRWLLAEGSPEEVAALPGSATGQCLRETFDAMQQQVLLAGTAS